MQETLSTVTAGPSPRRWFQFRLQTLLIVVAVLAIPLAWVANERRQSRFELQFAEQLRERGFTNTRLAGPYDSFELRSYSKPQGRWRDLALQMLGERLVFSGDAPPDFKDWPEFGVLSKLELLCLDSTQVSDLTPAADLKTLLWLSINYTPVSDLKPVARLTRLQELYSVGNQVSDLTPLAELKDLRILAISYTQVQDLTPLAGLTHLRELHVYGLSVHGLSAHKGQIEQLQKALPNCRIQHDELP